MTVDEQEALSHQYYGYWTVPLASGAIAVFNHPAGKLLAIVPGAWNEVLKVTLPPPPVYKVPESLGLDIGDLL